MHRHSAKLLSSLVLWTALLAGPCLAQTPRQVSLMVTAVPSGPTSITFTWPQDATATGYTVARRNAGTTVWGSFATVPGGGAATSFTDSSVTPGARYEYRFTKTGSPVAQGFLTAGIEASLLDDRGELILVVDASQGSLLGSRLDRLVSDLIGDGYHVTRHDVNPTDPVALVKALIAADAAAHPGREITVFLLGHVPVPYSGAINPDGHTNHYGAWPADVYYGDVDGNWTDSYVNATSASRAANRNVPNDGKFDQSYLPSDVDLMVGRVDLHDMPAFPAPETALLQQYLDKDHDYRHKVFAVDQRAIVDDNFGYFSGEAFAASGWRNFAELLGSSNVQAADYFTALNTTAGNGYAWSYGCGGGSYTSAGGIGNTANFTTSTNRNVFTMLFGSYFGDWDSTNNFLRAPLCSGWTLTNAWAGRPHWLFHPMGLGQSIGFCARLSQNDVTPGGYGARYIHVALMGDPTLRQHVVAPPSSVLVADLWPLASVTWSPSADPVQGYHVYRAASPSGPFVRLTQAPVAGTSFTDAAPLAGDSTYMVRAVRLETTPTGTYWNASQGAFATQRLPQQAASHIPFGEGCYAISDSVYESFETAQSASAGLGGLSIAFTPLGASYSVSASGNAYVPPSSAAVPLVLGDETEVAVPLSAPVQFAGAAVATLHVHSNGIVADRPLSLSPAASPVPDATAMLNEAASAFYSWHDFDPSEPGSGVVTVEERAGAVHVTWNGVESKPAAASNPSTVQFQFERTSGIIRICWPSISAQGSGVPAQERHLIGWSPAGPSIDAGPTDLLAARSLPVPAASAPPLSLSASPAPVSTASRGTVVTYAIAGVPELSPGSHLGLLALGFAADPSGPDLAAFGMPGCRSYLASADAALLASGTGPNLLVTLHLPAGLPPGLLLHATALAFFPPFGLPNGQNALGVLTSNGLTSLVNDH
ncbi:MAG: hypothetical protein Fur0037_06050 [Planctomycetota bacterium]